MRSSVSSPSMRDVPGRPTVAEVSLGALRANCREAQACVGPGVGVMAVVKADAYGHDAVAAARAFVEAGAAALGVSTVEEGVEIARAGLGAPARAVGRTVAVHVKVNTGMTRLGLEPGEVGAFAAAIRDLPGVAIAGVFSHFASADDLDTAAARTQLARFAEARAALAAAGVHPPLVHLANSAAVLSLRAAHFTMVRPGLMLYGYAPAPHLAARARLRPALCLC